MPESVKKIGDYAFSEIAALKEINLPDSITEIGTEAFRKCSGLTNIKLPEGLTALGGRAFAECENLAEIYIPAHLTDVGGYIEDENGNASYSSPFYGCAALRTVPSVYKGQTVRMAEFTVLLRYFQSAYVQYASFKCLAELQI